MADEPYRQNLRPGLQTCTACGTPTDPARIVYSKAGDPICPGCESAAEGEERLKRGAAGAAWAAFAFGAVGTVALGLLVGSLPGMGRDHMTHNGYTYYRGAAWKTSMQLGAGWMSILTLLIVLGAVTIVGAHRTLGSPAVRKAIGDRRKRLLLLSWAGIPAVPAFFIFWQLVFIVIAMVR
jgi:hypothetical protein